jgi:hypothetical protein
MMLGSSSRLLGAYSLASSSLADTLEQATDDEELQSKKTVKYYSRLSVLKAIHDWTANFQRAVQQVLPKDTKKNSRAIRACVIKFPRVEEPFEEGGQTMILSSVKALRKLM